MSIIQTADARLYLQVTHPWAPTIPNTTGTATLAGTDACRHISCQLSPRGNVIQSAAKTGSRGRLKGMGGRRGAGFNLVVPLCGSGAAGTESDLGPIWQALTGKTPTIVASTSVAYGFASTASALTIWHFQDPSTSNNYQQALAGGLIDALEIAAGPEEEARVTLSGNGVYVPNKPNFSSLDATAKAGLTAFPTEPVSPTYIGDTILAFVGSITINSVGTFALESVRLRVSLNTQIRAPFGSYYPTVIAVGVRDVTVDFSIYEEDTAAQAALRLLQFTKGTFNISLTLGDQPGNIYTFLVKNVMLANEEKQDSGLESIIQFSGCPAAMTSAGANDELTITQT